MIFAKTLEVIYLKKIFTAILFSLLLLLLSLTSGCGSSNDKPANTVGMLTQLNSTPEQAAKFSNGAAINFYENFNSMQMALQSEQIKSVRTYKSVAEYMTANNSDLKINDAATIQLVDDFCCAMRSDDVDLKNSFDTAINAMKSDGTLNALIEKNIVNANETPATVEMPQFDGADTVKVAVTGDLPPLDFVNADGTPAGFNTALLAEISKRIGKNIELVQVDSGARAAALTSGQVDVIFWVVVPEDDSRPKNIDTPDGVSVTSPYYRDTVVDVNLSNLGGGF